VSNDVNGPNLPFAHRQSCCTAARQTGLSLRMRKLTPTELTHYAHKIASGF
jgi:hypothetical protein